jgi:hypothetical protein
MAIERTWSELPSPFPKEIAESIRKAILSRLDQIKYASSNGWKL